MVVGITFFFHLAHLLVQCLMASLALAATDITTDQSALVALKLSISDPHKILTSNWSSQTPVCNWFGVTCGFRHRRVTALNISNMGLQGSISPQLGNLTFLISLDMKGNNLSGSLPEELVGLRRLSIMRLSHNNFSGSIPEELVGLRRLSYLGLTQNKFSGEIPSSLGSLFELQFLSLADNSFTGLIPRSISNLTKLQYLSLSSNYLRGEILEVIRNLRSLRTLDIGENQLTGTIPENLCHYLPNLEGLYLYQNRLNGQLPQSLNNCSGLQVLSVFENYFTGPIPREIGNLTMLLGLHIHNNRLTGMNNSGFFHQIDALLARSLMTVFHSYIRTYFAYLQEKYPPELGNLYNLKMIFLATNSLSGSIPEGIFNISTLTKIELAFNQLSGSLPSTVGCSLPNLVELKLHVNSLSGRIPACITNSSQLIVLALNTNNFSGPIPNSLGDLRYLQLLNLALNNLSSDSSSPELSFITSLTNCKFLIDLELSNNPLNGILPASIGNLSTSLLYIYAPNCKIKGSIPQEIGNLSNLMFLSLFHNELTGFIPPTMVRLQELQELYLRQNEINGSFPSALCQLQKLGGLGLQENQLSGAIPDCIGNATSLRYLYLDNNSFTEIPASLWKLEDILELSLSANSLSGSLPLEIGNLNALVTLDLSINQFSGDIPSTIGGLLRLNYLSLAYNRLEGSIPDSIGNMLSLGVLNLSHNALSGHIPKSLEKLQDLNVFNVSSNQLRGEIPTAGPFKNFTSLSFLFNEALCGAPIFNVPPCTKSSIHTSKNKAKLHLALIIFGVATIVLAMSLAIWLMRYRRKKDASSSADLLSPTIVPGKVSYYELLQATDRFSQSNLLGSGSYGSVYKGVLKDGTFVAVKVFNWQTEGAFQSFDRECEVFRSLRHRNLTKVITSCSNNDFKALVLEYMPKGSLEKWLYSHNHFLDIMQRLNIMIDVACALEYLHHGSTTPVVHCDIKPSNVLLDEDMVAHVTDFGISKLLFEGDSTVNTRTLATLGYIAPEYGQEGLVSTRCDVYSFGIMLMEVFTRVKPSNEMFLGDVSLKSWINDSTPGGIIQVVDTNLIGPNEQFLEEKLNCLSSILELALHCSAESPNERVNMKDVAATLKSKKLQFSACLEGCRK